MELAQTHLREVFGMKYGPLAAGGWAPRLWHRLGYFTPDEYYESLVAGLVTARTRWLDVGCGRDLFPANPRLARDLVGRCETLVGLDPDANVLDNPFVHERVQAPLEGYACDRPFSLVTLRMVAEHVADPQAAVAALARLTQPGGKVVVYTVYKWSPVAVAARLVPFRLHHAVKRLVWRAEERDTFPVAYRMNTRGHLARVFEATGFRECSFAHLDDCRCFFRFRWLHHLDLGVWRLLRAVGLRHPETCLLAVYERV